MPRVEKYMQRDFIRVPDTTQISQVLKMMFESGENYVVVVRGGVQIAGIVTRTDIISLRSTIVLKEGYVRDIVGDQTLIAMMPQDFMQDARSKFERYANIDQLIVLELLTPIGILTKHDVIRWMYEEEFANLPPD
jgi:CBS domain-containing protein